MRLYDTAAFIGKQLCPIIMFTTPQSKDVTTVNLMFHLRVVSNYP
jgi:hypothetical protein